ncbi:glycosyltransferase family 2 protein [Mucilaginibacter ginkgonis]|uniref:Glycosyltransferase n=1 Tax=Mucilaginibacter ginkgonis TaxID=2682091 RepID=A0A6I4I252_9SPHI|nr:glycosyltransferase family 2 protein [Mucilaginibacter ginkgonis]QQL50854.1 glycosyltransferase [Mucilaginibacter ginkgonis]
MPFFSVIIATYNSQKTLKRALDSIIEQTFTDFEIVIADGASKDDTMSIIKSFDPKYFGIILSEKDSGIYDAWNKGVNVARGEWICFLGSDDYFEKDAFKSYHNAITNSSTKLNYVSSKVCLVTTAGRQIGIIGKPWHKKTFKKYMTVAHVGSMHHRSLYSECGLYDTTYKSSGDYELLLRAGDNLKAGFLDKLTAFMEYGGTSAGLVGLKETYKAKIVSGKVPKFKAFIEHLDACARLIVRRFIYERK